MTTTKLDKAVLEIIMDAICDGAREWDAFAVPATQEPAKEALRKIKKLLESKV